MTLPKSHLLRSVPSGITLRDPLAFGTWFTPSATRGALVILFGGTSLIGAGDDLSFSIELRDLSDVAVTGFPMEDTFTYSAAVLGTVDIKISQILYVPPGYDYRIVDNSTGTGVVPSAKSVEILL